jgi:hypothetical protein
MARVPTQKEIAAFIVGHGIVDFVTGGTLSRIERNALWKVIKRLGPPAARGAVGIVPSVARTVGMVAMRHPYVAAGAVIYVGVTEREKIRTLLEQGYDVIEERLPMPSLPTPGIPRPSIPGVEEILLGGPAALPFGKLRPRRPSAFNKAVSAGMKAIRKDKTYGGKGQIKPSKKAFSVVVKMAAAKKKKKKAPKSGIRRRIWNAMKGLQ